MKEKLMYSIFGKTECIGNVDQINMTETILLKCTKHTTKNA